MNDAARRIFALVDLLQSRGRMTSGALAACLGVSERTIRRDLVRLHDLDVPITVIPGRHGGVSIEPGSLLAPLRFTDAELLALLLGLRSITPASHGALATAATSALRRLDAVMTPRARARAQALGEVLAVAPSAPPRGATAHTERILELAEAIHARQRVTIGYVAHDGTATVRSVDPYGLVQIGNWYVAAYCHLRRDLRTFRLDRIRRLDPTAASFERPASFDAFGTVAASLAQAPTSGPVVCTVRLDIDLESATRAVPPGIVLLEPCDDGVLLTVRAHPDELERISLHLLRMPWPVEILGPDELRSALMAVGRRALTVAS